MITDMRFARVLMAVVALGLWFVPALALGQPATPSPVPSNGLAITTRNGSCETGGQIQPGGPPSTTVTFTNEEPEPHQVLIVELQLGKQASDLTPEVIDSALTAEPESDPVVRRFLGGPGAILTGGTEEVILEFPAEDDAYPYVAICSIPGHDDEAIVQDLIGSGPAGEGEPIEPDVSVTLTDDAIDMEVEISGGRQLWRVTNEGTRPHDLVLAVISPTMTEVSIQSFIQQNDGALPENVAAGGMRILSPGTTGWLEFDLPPGQYLAICDLEQISRVFSVDA